MIHLWHDLRFALRSLRRAPGFVVPVLAVLGLGVGAVAAVFGLVDGVLWRPLPYERPDELHFVSQLRSGRSTLWASGPNFQDLREQTKTFADIAAYTPDGVIASGAAEPESIDGAEVSPNLPGVLGLEPAMGRVFAADEAGAPVALISADFRRRQYGAADPIGEMLELDGRAFEVIGVLPDVQLLPEGVDVWIPLRLDAPDWRTRRGIDWLILVGRLASGVTVDEARAELESLGATLAREYPDANADESYTALPLAAELVGDIRTPLLAMWGAVCLVLAVICANLGALTAARSLRRSRELAIREALGSGRGRIARQILIEGVLLGMGGWLLGMGVGAVGFRGLLAAAPPDTPRLTEVGFDMGAAAAALAAGLVAGIGASLVPALRVASGSGVRKMLTGGRVGAPAVRGGFVVAQVAASVCLLVVAVLLLQSLWRLSHVDPGFRADGVLTVSLPVAGSRFADTDERARHYVALLEAASAVPGVTRAALVNALPLRGPGPAFSFEMRTPPSDTELLAGFRVATAGYFETLQIPVVQGRTFLPEEDADGPPVVIVDQAFEESFFPGRSALGQEIELLDAWRRIVGVVGSVRDRDLDSPGGARVYVPLEQGPRQNLTLVARTTGDPSALLPGVRGALRAVDPEQALATPSALDAWVHRSVADEAFLTRLLVSFASVALLLAAIGLYGLLGASVSERGREIGVRLAVGGSSRAIRRMVLLQGLGLAAVGVAIGLLLAWLAAGTLASVLYEVDPGDPAAFAVVPVVLGAVAALAAWLPARRASRVDPVEALRAE